MKNEKLIREAKEKLNSFGQLSDLIESFERLSNDIKEMTDEVKQEKMHLKGIKKEIEKIIEK